MLYQYPTSSISRDAIEAAVDRARRARNAEVARLIGLGGQKLRRNLRLALIAASSFWQSTVRNLTRHA